MAMAFGSNREDMKMKTSAERSAVELQERKPIFNGPARDTFEEGGNCLFMGRPVSKEEYDGLLEKYNTLLDHVLEGKKHEVEQELEAA